MKWLVLLSGCGLGDGSCIEETVMSYIALDRYHCDYLPVAENRIEPSVDHFTERTGERRSVLTESARIGRGDSASNPEGSGLVFVILLCQYMGKIC